GGASREAEARRYYAEALQSALHSKLAPIALDIFVGVAQLHLRRSETQRAGELLALAEHHSASTDATQKQARNRSTALAPLSSNAQKATSHAQLLDWQIVAHRLVEELSAPHWNPPIAI